jgi:hypothetical protein
MFFVQNIVCISSSPMDIAFPLNHTVLDLIISITMQ